MYASDISVMDEELGITIEASINISDWIINETKIRINKKQKRASLRN